MKDKALNFLKKRKFIWWTPLIGLLAIWFYIGTLGLIYYFADYQGEKSYFLIFISILSAISYLYLIFALFHGMEDDAEWKTNPSFQLSGCIFILLIPVVSMLLCGLGLAPLMILHEISPQIFSFVESTNALNLKSALILMLIIIITYAALGIILELIATIYSNFFRKGEKNEDKSIWT